MKKQTGKDRKHKSVPSHGPKLNIRMLLLLLLVGAVVVTGVWYLKSRDSGAQAPASAVVQTDFQLLRGRWRRSDSDYVLVIKRIDDSGRMDAAYVNPRSIRVNKAEASRQGDFLKVSIELRDEGYPGSTYELTYDQKGGVLRGKYYQAAIKETFDVVFVKMT